MLAKPWLWIALAAAVGLLVLLAGVVLWVYVRARLRGAREALGYAATAEDWLRQR